MPSLPSLLKHLSDLHRQHATLEAEIAAVEQEITSVAIGPRKRRSSRTDGRPLAGRVKAVVELLREAKVPLERREVAERLHVSLSTAGYRLGVAVRQGFVERMERGRYACVAEAASI